MDWDNWLKGIVAGLVGGASNAVTLIIVDPLHYNLLQGGAKDLGMVALVSAIVGAALYLKTHPLPDNTVMVTTNPGEQPFVR